MRMREKGQGLGLGGIWLAGGEGNGRCGCRANRPGADSADSLCGRAAGDKSPEDGGRVRVPWLVGEVWRSRVCRVSGGDAVREVEAAVMSG